MSGSAVDPAEKHRVLYLRVQELGKRCYPDALTVEVGIERANDELCAWLAVQHDKGAPLLVEEQVSWSKHALEALEAALCVRLGELPQWLEGLTAVWRERGQRFGMYWAGKSASAALSQCERELRAGAHHDG